MLVDIKVVSVHEKMGKDKAKMKLKGYTYICYTYIYIFQPFRSLRYGYIEL